MHACLSHVYLGAKMSRCWQLVRRRGPPRLASVVAGKKRARPSVVVGVAVITAIGGLTAYWSRGTAQRLLTPLLRGCLNHLLWPSSRRTEREMIRFWRAVTTGRPGRLVELLGMVVEDLAVATAAPLG